MSDMGNLLYSADAYWGVLDEGAHWHHLANTTEPSVCDGDAALCQITMTTCFIITNTLDHKHQT